MGMVLRSDTETGIPSLPVQSSSRASAALTGIHYVQIPKVEFSEAHGMAKIIYHHRIQSGLSYGTKICSYTYQKYIHIHKSGHVGSWAGLVWLFLPNKKKGLQHYQDVIVKSNTAFDNYAV